MEASKWQLAELPRSMEPLSNAATVQSAGLVTLPPCQHSAVAAATIKPSRHSMPSAAMLSKCMVIILIELVGEEHVSISDTHAGARRWSLIDGAGGLEVPEGLFELAGGCFSIHICLRHVFIHRNGTSARILLPRGCRSSVPAGISTTASSKSRSMWQMRMTLGKDLLLAWWWQRGRRRLIFLRANVTDLADSLVE